jgi:hypothetical protein
LPASEADESKKELSVLSIAVEPAVCMYEITTDEELQIEIESDGLDLYVFEVSPEGLNRIGPPYVTSFKANYDV